MRHQSAEADREVAKIAAHQHGVVSVSQLRAAGLDRSAVKRRAQAGRLHQIHRGVYAVGHSHLSVDGRRMAAVLACGRQAVVSHRSAAAAWGLLPDRQGAIDISTPSEAGKKRRDGIRLHRRPHLSPKDVTRRRGVPITTPARTIADLGEVAPRAEVRRAQRQAAVLGLPLGTGVEQDATRSELESIFLRLCRQYGLPAPEVNVRIAGVLVDFAWRERRLIVETDGYRYHRGRVSFEEDRARDLQLRSRGFEVIRLTYDQVARRHKETASALRRVLTSRASNNPEAVGA